MKKTRSKKSRDTVPFLTMISENSLKVRVSLLLWNICSKCPLTKGQFFGQHCRTLRGCIFQHFGMHDIEIKDPLDASFRGCIGKGPVIEQISGTHRLASINMTS
jgi:hypothetical protein